MNKIKDILANIGNVTAGTWVRLIVMIAALVNMALGAFGVAPLKFDENELYTIVSVVLAIVAGLLAYWKNNSFTAAAQAADEYLHNQGFAVEDGGNTDVRGNGNVVAGSNVIVGDVRADEPQEGDR